MGVCNRFVRLLYLRSPVVQTLSLMRREVNRDLLVNDLSGRGPPSPVKRLLAIGFSKSLGRIWMTFDSSEVEVICGKVDPRQSCTMIWLFYFGHRSGA